MLATQRGNPLAGKREERSLDDLHLGCLNHEPGTPRRLLRLSKMDACKCRSAVAMPSLIALPHIARNPCTKSPAPQWLLPTMRTPANVGGGPTW